MVCTECTIYKLRIYKANSASESQVHEQPQKNKMGRGHTMQLNGQQVFRNQQKGMGLGASPGGGNHYNTQTKSAKNTSFWRQNRIGTDGYNWHNT